jgi:shikimate kinase
MVIFLIGFMGSGKSWWLHRLAGAIQVPHFDLDELVEESEGMEIPDIFRERGEPYFRQKEREVLEALVRALNGRSGNWSAVVACGGGTPCFFDNMDWMNQVGLTVWLNPEDEVLASRLITETANRPLLAGKTGSDLEELIAHLKFERQPFYEKARVEIKNTHIALDDFLNVLKNAQDLP